jgi:hypothetical protein
VTCERTNTNDERECTNTTHTHPVNFDQIILSIKTAPTKPTLISHIHLNGCILFVYNRSNTHNLSQQQRFSPPRPFSSVVDQHQERPTIHHLNNTTIMEPRQSADGGPTSPTHSTLVVMPSKTLRVNFAPLASQPSLDFGGSPPPESHMRTLGAWGGRVGRPFARARACALPCVQAGGTCAQPLPQLRFVRCCTLTTRTQPPSNKQHTYNRQSVAAQGAAGPAGLDAVRFLVP